MAKVSIGILSILIIITSVFLLFFFTVSPDENAQYSSQWNLLLLGTLGGAIVTFTSSKNSLFQEYFEATSLKEGLSEYAIGLFPFGLLTLLFVVFAQNTITFLNNLTATYNVLDLGTVTTSGVFFITIVQPFSESLLMMVLILVLYTLFSRDIKFPFPMFTAILFTFIIFAGFHFTVQGAEFYPFDGNGFFEFLTDTKGLGTPDYHGGFVFLPMGFFWGLLGVVYKSFFTMAGAHTAYNTIILFAYSDLFGSALESVKTLLIVFILIILFAFIFGNAIQKIQSASFKEVFSLGGRA